VTELGGIDSCSTSGRLKLPYARPSHRRRVRHLRGAQVKNRVDQHRQARLGSVSS
jgi:hypothetical protein